MIKSSPSDLLATRRDREPGGGAILQGVKRRDWRRGADEARKVGAKLAGRDEIAYWPAELSGQSEAALSEQRRSRRKRPRLRSAKLLDERFRFLSECRICDQSPDGARLALSRRAALPPQLAVYFDETGEVRTARVAWRRGRIVGVSLREFAPASALTPSERYALGERYYAVLD
jgi:hypothetical protein